MNLQDKNTPIGKVKKALACRIATLLSLCFLNSACSEETVINLYDDNTILVAISSGEIQCQFEGNPISVSQGFLIDAGIEVSAAYCGFTNEQYVTVCGGATSDIHIFEIDKKYLNKAENLGFNNIESLQAGWQKTDCPE